MIETSNKFIGTWECNRTPIKNRSIEGKLIITDSLIIFNGSVLEDHPTSPFKVDIFLRKIKRV